MIEIDERGPWNSARNVLLIGPGGAGKSSLGVELAPLLNRQFVDLDHEFLHRFGDISSVIRDEGYETYKTLNSGLAGDIAAGAVAPMLLITSSGFLTPDNPDLALKANRRLLATSYSICLLPSRDLERAVGVIVERQMTRAFARGRAAEEATIRSRYAVYARLGDLIVFSAAPLRDIAQAIACRLSARV